MLSCSIWFSALSFWMGGGLESRCVGRVYGADGAVHGTIRTVNTTYAAALKTTTHPKTRRRKPYAATQRLIIPMMCVCTYTSTCFGHICSSSSGGLLYIYIYIYNYWYVLCFLVDCLLSELGWNSVYFLMMGYKYARNM